MPFKTSLLLALTLLLEAASRVKKLPPVALVSRHLDLESSHV